MNLSFHNNYTFLKKIDSLSTGLEWTCQIVTAHGNKVGKDGVMMSKDLELWKQNPVDCVKELISNLAFQDLMAYVPQCVYSNKAGINRVYDEMWMVDWWWNTQVSLSNSQISSNGGSHVVPGQTPLKAVLTPVIIVSDKTTLSQLKATK